MVKKNYDNMLSRFHLIPERDGQTDRQTDGRTDGQNYYINIAHQCADARLKLVPIDTHLDPGQRQNLTTFRGSNSLPMPTMFGRRPLTNS